MSAGPTRTCAENAAASGWPFASRQRGSTTIVKRCPARARGRTDRSAGCRASRGRDRRTPCSAGRPDSRSRRRARETRPSPPGPARRAASESRVRDRATSAPRTRDTPAADSRAASSAVGSMRTTVVVGVRAAARQMRHGLPHDRPASRRRQLRGIERARGSAARIERKRRRELERRRRHREAADDRRRVCRLRVDGHAQQARPRGSSRGADVRERRQFG